MNEGSDLPQERSQAADTEPFGDGSATGTQGGPDIPPPDMAARDQRQMGQRRAGRRKKVVADLDPSEQAVIWILRQWLSGASGEMLVRQELFNLCRLTGIESALQGLEGLIETLGHCARRVMTLHCCRCREVSHDEQLLLFLVAAAQRRDAILLEALARWLVPIESSEDLIVSAQRFGSALSHGGHKLPLEIPKPEGQKPGPITFT